MSYLEALLLGMIQGITEFFPVSSSAHLFFAKKFLHLQQSISFDLACHGGTLLATLIFLRKQVFSLLIKEPKKLLFFFLAIFPLVPVYFFTRPLINYLSQEQFIAFFLLASSSILFLIAYLPLRETKSPLSWKKRDMLFIGTMQAMALIPGFSRSGSTIGAACFRGWRAQEAITFSFLLAIPTVFGGTLLEALKTYKEHGFIIEPTTGMAHVIGFLTAFVVGLFAIRFIFKLASRKTFAIFAWYCCCLGCLAMGLLR